MAENVEIIVSEKGARVVRTNIEDIAKAARTTQSTIEFLKKSLNFTGANAGLNSVNRAITDAVNSSNRFQTSIGKVAAGESAIAVSANKAAISHQRLAQEVQKTQVALANTENALSRAIASEQRAIAAADRSAVASIRLAQAKEKAARSVNTLSREAENLKRELFPLYAAQENYNASVDKASYLFAKGAIDLRTYTAAVDHAESELRQAKVAQDSFNNSLLKTSGNARLARHHMLNLGFQLQDVGVSLASGQNPLTVAVQQGAQIQGIASQAGVSLGRMAIAVAQLVSKLIPFAAVLGAVYGSFKLFQSQVSDPGALEAYARELGATSEQIKDLDLDTITFMDTLNGLWSAIDDRTGAGDIFAGIWYSAKETFKTVLEYIALSIQSIMALGQALVDFYSALWTKIADSAKRTFSQMVNNVLSYYETLTNGIIDATNLIIAGLNKVSAVKIDPLQNVNFTRLDVAAEQSGQSLSQVFLESYVKNLEGNKTGFSKFVADWLANSEKAAKARIQKSLKDDTADSRETSLAKINLQLDNQIQRLGMLKPAREAQQKFDQIEEQLAGKRIKLTKDESAALMQKITTLQNAEAVQKQFDAVYEDAVGPLREYNATLKASDELLKLGAITQAQHAQSVLKAQEAYADSQDPLRQYTKSLMDELELLHLLPAQREIEAELMQLQNDLLRDGQTLKDEELKQLRDALALRQQLLAVAREEENLISQGPGARQQFESQTEALKNLRGKPESGFTRGDEATAVDSALGSMGIDTSAMTVGLDAQLAAQETYYEQLKALRANDLISEQDYSAAKVQLYLKEFDIRTQHFRRFFDGLSELQNSNSKRLARIGKAAAITNAIIDTYKSATGAYSAMASIPYVGPALGAAAAAAAIAAGMANVNAIRSQPAGFRDGGYTGNRAVNEVAGVVHGREYVMDAATTSRIGVDNLDAMRAGAPWASPVSGGGSTVNITVENHAPGVKVEAKQMSPTDIRIIARQEAAKQIEERTPDLMAAQIREPNSKVSKALATSTTTQRQR